MLIQKDLDIISTIIFKGLTFTKALELNQKVQKAIYQKKDLNKIILASNLEDIYKNQILNILSI